MNRMNRNVTNKVNRLLDHWIPPAIRDSRLFAVIAFRLVLGKKYAYYLEFKRKAPFLSEKDINKYYEILKETFIVRDTDCNRSTVKRIIKEAVGPKILDAASGRGYMAMRLFQEDSNLECTAADIVLPDKRTRYPGLNYIAASVTNLPFEDQEFDTVICTHAIEHIKDGKKAVSELRRVCKQKLIIVVPRQREYSYTFDLHLNFFPYQYDVENFMGAGRMSVELLDNDWICIEKMDI